MKKLLMTATALFAVGGVTAAVADITISGKVRYHYQTWSDDNVDTGVAESGNNNSAFAEDLHLWVKSDFTADSGLSYGTGTRLRTGGFNDGKLKDGTVTDGKVGDKISASDSTGARVDRNYIYLRDDWGQIKLGKDWAPSYNMSLAADWRGSVSGNGYTGPKAAGDSGLMTSSWNVHSSGHAMKIAYYTPSIGGFKAGAAFGDAGASSKANTTSFAAIYALPIADGSLRLGYGMENADHASGASDAADSKIAALGAEFTRGSFLGAVNRITNKATQKDKAKTKDQTADEFEVAYDVNSNVKLNYVYFSSKEKAGANKDDTFKSNAVGVKYTAAPGLLISLSHNAHKYKDKDMKANDNSGSATRLEFRVNF